MRSFLARAAGNDLADELAQDTFLRAWQRAGHFRGQGSYTGWLYRIGWRLFLDRYRTDLRRTARESAVPPDLPYADHGGDAALDAERLLALLDQRTRAALVLCEGHGFSHGEAAEVLGLPLGTLKSLIVRGKARLRAVIEQGARL